MRNSSQSTTRAHHYTHTSPSVSKHPGHRELNNIARGFALIPTDSPPLINQPPLGVSIARSSSTISRVHPTRRHGSMISKKKSPPPGRTQRASSFAVNQITIIASAASQPEPKLVSSDRSRLDVRGGGGGRRGLGRWLRWRMVHIDTASRWGTSSTIHRISPVTHLHVSCPDTRHRARTADPTSSTTRHRPRARRAHSPPPITSSTCITKVINRGSIT